MARAWFLRVLLNSSSFSAILRSISCLTWPSSSWASRSLISSARFLFSRRTMSSCSLDSSRADLRRNLYPNDVIVPAQNTGLGPEKTSFFQALAIPTKISRGTIEITSNVHLLKPGDKVGASDATLLNMLKISPFTYGLEVNQVYDNGTCFSPAILDITEDDLRARLL